MDSTRKNHLEPVRALTNRVGQLWDPTIGAYRAQRLPITLSKSSVLANHIEGDTEDYQSVRFSNSSRASIASTSGSSAITYSHSSIQSPPPSPISKPSKDTTRIKARLNQPKRGVRQVLPSEVYDCILGQLRKVHEGPYMRCCQTCYLRDLCSLSLTNRAWDKAVVKRLYHCVRIVGPDSKGKCKSLKVKTGVRLKLLRRSLRERSFLAQHVRELEVHQPQSEGAPTGNDMNDIVASVVMACPNLERLTGFYYVYNHEFDRLTYALSTRRKLKEHVWLIGENGAITQRSHKQLAPGLMDPEQKASFVFFHNAWSSLTTLFLHSPNQGILEKDIFVNKNSTNDPRKLQGPGILQRLPALKHLCISGFDMDDLDDVTLQHLPALHSLRLQDLEGVTFWGLSEFSRTPNASSLRNLSLVNLDIMYISAISNLLLHLKNLTRLTLVQDSSPEVAEGEIVFQPIIASHQLEYIHWDIAVPGSANVNLASSIRAKGFPRLRTIRAPSDHNGLLQALCKPRAQIEIPGDQASSDSDKGMASYSLGAARQAAQCRIEDAWNTVQFKVVVEESGIVHEIYDLPGFAGAIGSKIYYSLEPDIAGSDTALIDFPDILGGEAEAAVTETCKGDWNASHPRGPKWWQHTERSRYPPIDLQTFF